MKVNLSNDANKLEVEESINDTEDEALRSLIIKSITEMHRKRMMCSSWANNQVYDQHILTLENMNLRDFYTNFCADQWG